MLKAYRKSQQSQLNWMRKHPGQYIAVNAILIVVFIAFIELKDRYEMRKYENETPSK